MRFRDFFARLSCRQESDTEGIVPSIPPRPRSQVGGKQNSRFSFNSFLQFESGATGDATSQIPSASDHHPSASNVDESKPVELSSYIVDPTAAYENKPNWKSTLYASAGLAIDVVKESSDVFTPLKSVAGGLSAVLRYYDVRRVYLLKLWRRSFFESASDGEPRNDRIANTPGRRPCGITQRTRSRGRDQGDK